MDNKKINTLFLWGGFLVLTLFVVINLYSGYQKEKERLGLDTQSLFQEAVQIDTDRRCKEEGDDFRFSYGSAFNKDTITITSVDTIIYIKNNKEVAQKMSDKEKIDFSIQLCLAFENPIQATSLDSLFQTLLMRQQIPARTAVVYTFCDESQYSCSDSSFYQSAEALEEVAFGPAKTIVLQAFVQIPFYYKIGKAVLSSSLFILVWIIALFVVLWLSFSRRGRKIHIVPAPEAPKVLVEIVPGLFLDDTHGILQSGDRQVELINFRLKLFLVLLEHKGYFIETDKLVDLVWPDGSVTKDALSSTVKRLKGDISLFPEIEIESSRGKGYVLFINREVKP